MGKKILALGCERVLSTVEEIAEWTAQEQGNEVSSAKADTPAQAQQCSSGYEYAWCASAVAAFALTALAWGYLRKSPERRQAPEPRRDEFKAELLECRRQLRAEREKHDEAAYLRDLYRGESALWQRGHQKELEAQENLGRKLRRCEEQVIPGLRQRTKELMSFALAMSNQAPPVRIAAEVDPPSPGCGQGGGTYATVPPPPSPEAPVPAKDNAVLASSRTAQDRSSDLDGLASTPSVSPQRASTLLPREGPCTGTDRAGVLSHLPGAHSPARGGGDDTGGRRPYVFGRAVVLQPAGPNEESAKKQSFTFRAPDAAPGVSPAAAVSVVEAATTSFIAAMAAVSDMEDAANGGGRSKGLVPYASETSRFSFGAGLNCTAVVTKKVPGSTPHSGGAGGGAAGERRLGAFGRVVSQSAGPKEESAKHSYTFRARDAGIGAVSVAGVAAAKALTASSAVATATISATGDAGSREGSDAGLGLPAREPGRASFGLAASSAVTGDGVSRTKVSTTAPLSAADTVEAKAPVASVSTAGLARPSQRAPGLEGGTMTFGAGDDIGAITTKESTKSTGGKGLKYIVIRGRRVYDDASRRVMKAIFEAKQKEAERLEAKEREDLANSHVRRVHRLSEMCRLDNCYKINVDDSADGERGKGEGNGDDDCDAQGGARPQSAGEQ